MATLTSPPPEQEELAARHAQTVICLSKLPPFHPAALKLLNIASDSDTAIDDFEAIFRVDPALTADLLLVANSPLFGNRATIASIRHALMHLGLDRVRSLATTIALSFFVRNQPRTAFVRHIWAHSIATATICEILGKVYRTPDLYTAGLVHDLGRLGLLLTLGQTYEKWASVEVPGVDESNQRERNHFGMNHCDAALLVAQRWGFPEVLQECMIEHHDPHPGRAWDSVPLVQLACRMASSLGYPEVYQAEPETFPELPERARACPDLALERIQERVNKQIDMIGK
ncbi:MAG: HDOD domain-containing protein [Ignavibacteriota bacterium]